MCRSDIMMMALDVSHSTFPHRRDLDLDLDLVRRPDLDLSAAGARNKRLRSAAEMTSSSPSSPLSRDAALGQSPSTRFAATSRGPFSKLKVEIFLCLLTNYSSFNRPNFTINTAPKRSLYGKTLQINEND